MNWKEEIVKLVYVKQALAEADVTGLWPHHLPSVGASSAEILEAESSLGFKIDQQFIDFLLCANGWSGFYQTVDLFGTKDFIGGEKFKYAKKIADSLTDSAFLESGIQRDAIFPIAVTKQDKDIFLVEKNKFGVHSCVVWFSGSFVDKFLNFEEFFLAMVDYNREEVEYFKKGK